MALSLALIGTAAAAAPSDATIAEHGTGATPACSSCHGSAGQGQNQAGVPRLAGLNADYLRRQLQAFADAHRQNPVMTPIAKALTPAEIAAVSEYYAALPPPARPARNGSPPSDRGQIIARRGIWQKALPGCEQCHGPDGIGIGTTFPALAGQSGTYIANQLHDWAQGLRPAGSLGLMAAVAKKLSDAEIDAVSAYFASLTPAAATRETRR